MRLFLCLFLMCCCLPSAASAQWQEQQSGVDVQLRGISAVSENVAWASGGSGTVLRTIDGGKNWSKLSIDGADKLDFRNIRAFDDKTAYAMSIGPGEQSRIYKTTDGGEHWQLQFTNRDPKAFYDCFSFWDRMHGIAVSDSVDGKFPLLITTDGSTWMPLVPDKMPPALPNEGAFAASGTCIATLGSDDVWFATGGPAARVFHSADQGQHWTVANTPLLSGTASQGIFSVLFWTPQEGVIVGGDYAHPDNSDKTAAYTNDGGQTWTLSRTFPFGYRSAAALVLIPKAKYSPTDFVLLIAVGTSGSDISRDVGGNWCHQSSGAYNAISFAENSGWAVGPQGRIGRIELPFGRAPNTELECVLTEMDHAAANFSRVQGNFEWDNYQKVVDETDKQKGKVYFSRNSKNTDDVQAMFDITSPQRKQVLFKSPKIQLYDLKLDQITEYQPGKDKADVDAFLSLGFGARGHDLLKSYHVEMLGWETVDRVRTAKLRLTPLSPKVRSMFSEFVLWIDPARDVPLKQQVLEPSGDYWISHYTGFILGGKISDDHFRIETTPKTTVVKPGG